MLGRAEIGVRAAGKGCFGVSRKLHGGRAAAEGDCSNLIGAAAHSEETTQQGRAEAEQSIIS